MQEQWGCGMGNDDKMLWPCFTSKMKNWSRAGVIIQMGQKLSIKDLKILKSPTFMNVVLKYLIYKWPESQENQEIHKHSELF